MFSSLSPLSPLSSFSSRAVSPSLQWFSSSSLLHKFVSLSSFSHKSPLPFSPSFPFRSFSSSSSSPSSPPQFPRVGVTVSIFRPSPTSLSAQSSAPLTDDNHHDDDDEVHKIPTISSSLTDIPPPSSPSPSPSLSLSPQYEVLLIKRSKSPFQGFWSLPGGTVESGESLKSAAEREIKEELGVEIDVFEPFYATDSIMTKGEWNRLKKNKEVEIPENIRKKLNLHQKTVGTDNNNKNNNNSADPNENPNELLYHWSLVHFLSDLPSPSIISTMKAQSDAIAFRWFTLDEISEWEKYSIDAKEVEGRMKIVPNTQEVVKRGEMWMKILTNMEG